MSEAVRSCAGCTMCCKLMGIAELDKPPLRWCAHCEIGVGCKIYETRPRTCSDFMCGYLTSAGLDERWRPVDCKIVLALDGATNRIFVHVEQADTWRKEPFYSRIKAWARETWKGGGQVLVWQGHDVVAVLPQKEVNLGRVRADQRIHTRETWTPTGVEYDVVLADAKPG